LLVLSCGLLVFWLWTFRWLGVARQQFELRQYRGAQKTLTRYLRWHPGSPEAHFLLGGVFGQIGDWKQALEHFERVSTTAPDSKEALWRVGDVSMMLNRAADAERALKKTLEHDLESLEARRGLITLYRWQDRELDAEPLVWQAYDLTPIEQRPLLLAEWFRFRFAQRPTGDTHRRLSAFQEAQPDDVQSAIALGLWSVRQRLLPEARLRLEKVFAQFPDHVDARAALATCLLELSEWNRLEQILDGWPTSDRDLRYWRIRGVWLQDFAADHAAAIACFERWVKHYPDDWQMRFRIGTCQRQIGKNDEADAEIARSEVLKALLKYEVVDEILAVTLRNLNRPEHRQRMSEFYRSIGYEREAEAWKELAEAMEFEGTRP